MLFNTVSFGFNIASIFFHLGFYFLHLSLMAKQQDFKAQLLPFFKIVTFTFVVFMSWSFTSFSLNRSLPLFFGISDPVDFLQNISHQSNAPAMLYVLALNSVGVFLLPALFYFFLFNIDPVRFLKLDSFPPLKYWVLGFFILFVAGIFIEVLVQMQMKIPLPEKLAFLRHQDTIVEDIIDAIFLKPTFFRFIVVSLTVAFLPALSEEIFFRGIIQNYLYKTNLGTIGAIVVTGLCFAIMHAEFDNTLAIWCMGIVLGFLYYYSGSLWVNITAHFLNNLIIIILKYAYARGWVQFSMTGNDILPLYLTLPAGAAMVTGLVVMRKWTVKNTDGIIN